MMLETSQVDATKRSALITGSSGFVATAIGAELASRGWHLSLVSRSRPGSIPYNAAFLPVENDADYETLFEGCETPEVVIHAAARVHVMQDDSADPLESFREVNVRQTLSLALAAAKAGVRRFIFISSIKVNGEATELGKPYTADDQPDPRDPYGVSKLEAEQGLRSFSHSSDMEIVIIRPVLVYGPGVKANFRSMMSWLRKGIPLPLGAIGNKRSLVAVDNLVDLIVTCIDHPAAANQTFLVSDGEDLSTTQLLQRMGIAMGRPARLLPVPACLLQAGAAMLGKRAIAQRLCGSLQVDIDKTRELLGWAPPVSVDDALRKTARAFEAG